MARISVSLSDLRRAVQQCEQLLERLMQQEQKMRSIHSRLEQDWAGNSATTLGFKMQSFLSGTSTRINELETHKEALRRYIHRMEEADREERRDYRENSMLR
ncbi:MULTISPECIES: WXG100 family type VII secretion target [Paenibacillus]|uniref:WXG100 family type VII secretion target n=1 Tax=Paenibacillus cucumis (ex Kampfer et al. 2016) TaxID=1776858 RepID=A0ABS7KE02_9BACL|nr:WXG100 family type VII secretion target [Paenibacillus cucumis (ex Kampfer et al. 2016)]MBY0202388.1 WXG100 family type VII secretion target [Paenibacillus cucumis (ex Kampfer et al. 2016)]MDP9701525.1 WXG100 family type VII secretion target [Paenibacillus intestini]